MKTHNVSIHSGLCDTFGFALNVRPVRGVVFVKHRLWRQTSIGRVGVGPPQRPFAPWPVMPYTTGLPCPHNATSDNSPCS